MYESVAPVPAIVIVSVPLLIPVPVCDTLTKLLRVDVFLALNFTWTDVIDYIPD